MPPKASSNPKKEEGSDDGPPELPETLLSLARLQQQEAELGRQAGLLQELLAENERLEAQRLEGERESFETGAFFRQELLVKNQEIEALQAEVDALGAKLSEAAAAAAAREAAAAAQHEAAVSALHSQLAELQGQLEGLEEFRQRRAELEAEAAGAREELAAQRAAHAEEVAALQRRLYEATRRQGSAGKQGAGDELGETFGGDVRRVLQHNKQMSEQMKTYAEEAEELQAGVRALEAQRAELLRDAQLRAEMEQQYALRGTLQAREIKGAASKIGSLERGMAQMAAAFEAERAALAQALRAHLAQAEAEQGALRRLLKLRTRELGQVRRLAHEVLLQRSDVEAFLLSSIQQVRLEIARGAVVARAPAGEGSSQQMEAAAVAAVVGQVDIRDLTWEDRERILRQLFARINQARKRPLAPQPQPSGGGRLAGAVTEAGPAGLA